MNDYPIYYYGRLYGDNPKISLSDQILNWMEIDMTENIKVMEENLKIILFKIKSDILKEIRSLKSKEKANDGEENIGNAPKRNRRRGHCVD